jgi:preprotein translocase subunit SecA
MSSSALDPTIFLGAYPHRSDERPGWLERNAEALLGAWSRWSNSRYGRLARIVPAVDDHARAMARESDAQLRARADHLRHRLRREGFTLAASAETFALIRELTTRRLGMRHFDVQLKGGWAMLQGMIAEMETGEGKTLTATLPACTAALAGIPVHVITVNDYLARRDAEWMGPVYEALGLSVGTVTAGMDGAARRGAYACDITYCTNKQVAFDHLRDRLLLRQCPGELRLRLRAIGEGAEERLIMRGLCFGIVDEADSVLVDEAVTPLIISRPADTSHKHDLFEQALDIAGELGAGRDYAVNLRERTLELTDAGRHRLIETAERLGGLWRNTGYREELVAQALRALQLYQRDQHYLIDDGRVKIIDEFTGRLMPDRSWERGLHQMIELKEGCEMTGEQETVGRISYQRFFRRYLMLAGMTGTAREVAGELRRVYGLSVARIPPNRRMRRRELPERVFATEDEKWWAVVERISALNEQGRPVLVGTRSVAASEHLSRLLEDVSLGHRVLNARQDEDEAEVIREAGRPGQITVATNMAGRGTDIRLSSELAERGGLHVIATERHEARRIDRQLFGRCGRQGDPGSHELFVSLEDELVTRYATEMSRRWARAALQIGPTRVLTSRIIRGAQRGAERQAAGRRRAVLRSEEYLSNVLAFSGQLE